MIDCAFGGIVARRRAQQAQEQAQQSKQQAKQAQQPKQVQAQLSKNQKLRLMKQGEERKKPLPHVDVEAAVPAEPVQQVRSAK